jgi:hypothetical protein
MRPQMPARKRWPCLKSALFSYASRSAAFLPALRNELHPDEHPSTFQVSEKSLSEMGFLFFQRNSAFLTNARFSWNLVHPPLVVEVNRPLPCSIAPRTEATPPKLYGDTERVIYWLTEARRWSGENL